MKKSHWSNALLLQSYILRCCDHDKRVSFANRSLATRATSLRLQPVQLCLLHLWVQWKVKTTALFVQVCCYTSMYLVWDISKWYVWRTVGHVQNSLWNPGLHTRGNLCPKWQSVHAPQNVNTPAQKIKDVEPEPKFQARYRFQLHHLKDLAPSRVQIIQNWLGSRSGCAVLVEF